MKAPTVSKVATSAAVALAVLELLLTARSGQTMKSLEDGFVEVLFACWLAAPLLLLGQIRVFWRHATAAWVLLLPGGLLLMLGLYETYMDPHGSTSSLGLIFIPLYLTVLYVLGAFLIWAFEVYRK
jgi:hypothetical protein